MSGPRVYNGQEWLPVPAVSTSSSTKPIEPILDGDGKIFVSIVSYRGTFVNRVFSQASLRVIPNEYL